MKDLATALEIDRSQVNGQSVSDPLPAGVPLAGSPRTSLGRFTGDQAKLATEASARRGSPTTGRGGGICGRRTSCVILGQGVHFTEAFVHRIQRYSFASFEADLALKR